MRALGRRQQQLTLSEVLAGQLEGLVPLGQLQDPRPQDHPPPPQGSERWVRACCGGEWVRVGVVSGQLREGEVRAAGGAGAATPTAGPAAAGLPAAATGGGAMGACVLRGPCVPCGSSHGRGESGEGGVKDMVGGC